MKQQRAELLRSHGLEPRHRVPLGVRPETIAESLGRISYGEAEEFCYGVRRRLALSPGQRPLKSIVAEQLKMWKARAGRADPG